MQRPGLNPSEPDIREMSELVPGSGKVSVGWQVWGTSVGSRALPHLVHWGFSQMSRTLPEAQMEQQDWYPSSS